MEKVYIDPENIEKDNLNNHSRDGVGDDVGAASVWLHTSPLS
jgi:hypothetical protein